jgi:CHASE1-domain containing sensor protein
VEEIKKRWNNRPVMSWRIPVIILVVYFLLIRSWAFVELNRNNNQTANSYFNHAVQGEVAGLNNRFEVYADALYSGRALFLTDKSVSRQDWTNFVNAQNIKQRYPGVNGISYVSVINRDQAASLAAKLNADRLPSEKKPIDIYPKSEDSQLAVITYLAPADISQSPIGYDMFADTSRKQMLDYARDTGLPRASTPLTLISNSSSDATPDFLLSMPVYKTTYTLGTAADRRAALEGYVVLSLHSQPLLDSVFQKVAFFDGMALTVSVDKRVVYNAGSKPGGHSLQKTVNANVSGQAWRFEFSAPDNFGLSDTARFAPTILLLSTIPIALIAGFMVYFGVRWQNLRKKHREKSE